LTAPLARLGGKVRRNAKVLSWRDVGRPRRGGDVGGPTPARAAIRSGLSEALGAGTETVSRGARTCEPERIASRNFVLRLIIMAAHGMPAISPYWLDSDRLEVLANVPGAAITCSKSKLQEWKDGLAGQIRCH